MPNILACRPGSYRDHRKVAFAHLAEIGVRYVEIPLPPPNEIADKRTELDRHGLTASSVQAPLNLKEPTVGESYKTVAATTRDLGASYIFVSAKKDDLDADVAYARLRDVGDACAQHDVTLVMETHPDLVTNGDIARETMEGVSHPNVLVNWDTANVYYYNESIDGVAELKKVAEHVGALHIKDTNGAYRAWHFPTIGDGIVDFVAVFRTLSEAGFEGPCTLELEGIEGENLNEDQAKQRVADSVAYLRRLGVL